METALWKMYLEGYCGLVCPFPRLEAMRNYTPIMEGMGLTEGLLEEMRELEGKEREYYEKKTNAQIEFQRLYKELHK